MLLMCFSTARGVSTSASAMAVLFLPCAICSSTSRSRGVRSRSGDCAARERAKTSASTTFGSMYEPPRATSRIAPELVGVRDTLLQQVGAACRAGFQQGEGILPIVELTQDDDTDLRVCLAERGGGANALVGSSRRHADICEHKVRPLPRDLVQISPATTTLSNLYSEATIHSFGSTKF
jgi:hypothetical protein